MKTTGNTMSDVKEEALAEAEKTYKAFLIFLKYLSYAFIAIIIVATFNNWGVDGTGSKHLPEEIIDQYDPQGLNKKKGI